MGLVDPVTVAGSSMAPSLRGANLKLTCPQCEYSFSVGAEYANTAAEVACPQCGKLDVPLTTFREQRGDRLWVDRTVFDRRDPRRWEVVVARNPENATELCVKRVVGLPGEFVGLRAGNVLIDGAVVTKSREARRALRQRIHRENDRRSQRWQAEELISWQFVDGCWRHDGQSEGADHWLRYQHPHEQPLTDDVTYNAGISRQLNLVDEFLLSAMVQLQGEGALSLMLDDGRSTARVELRLPDGEMTVWESGQRGSSIQLSSSGLQKLQRGEALIEFSNFDQQLLLVIDRQVELRRPWPRTRAVGVTRPVAIGARGIDVELRELTLYRDVYHGQQAANSPPPRFTQWQLGPAEYFLLGDNSPVSLDSRLWGPVPARLLVGKPLGNR